MMSVTEHGTDRGGGRHPSRGLLWIVVILALGIVVAYQLLGGPRGKETSPAETSKAPSGAKAGKELAGQRPANQKGTPSSSTKESQATATGVARELPKRVAQDTEVSRVVAPRDSRGNPPGARYAQAQQLLNKLKQMKPRAGKFSQEELAEINRLLQELKQQGQEGALAIREFLESGQNVSFAEFTGKPPPEYGSLRLALIDALAEMGGPEAAPFMAGMLRATTNLEEIALLAKGLEQAAPGVYQGQIMQVARTMLEQALNAPPGQYPGLGHLFGMIQEYGDASIAADLEAMVSKSPSKFTELALMALSKIPEGYGIPSLIKLTNEMAGNPGAYAVTYDMALRYLTQASREYPEASEALLGLVSANKINTTGLIQVANALGGMEHELITKTSDVSLQSRAETKISLRAAETWTDAQIDDRLVLIDQLLRTNPQQTVVKALQDARNRLLVWKGRPMIDGRRVIQ